MTAALRPRAACMQLSRPEPGPLPVTLLTLLVAWQQVWAELMFCPRAAFALTIDAGPRSDWSCAPAPLRGHLVLPACRLNAWALAEGCWSRAHQAVDVALLNGSASWTLRLPPAAPATPPSPALSASHIMARPARQPLACWALLLLTALCAHASTQGKAPRSHWQGLRSVADGWLSGRLELVPERDAASAPSPCAVEDPAEGVNETTPPTLASLVSVPNAECG